MKLNSDIPSKKPRQHYFNRPGQDWKFDEVRDFNQKGIVGWKTSEHYRDEIPHPPIKTMYVGNESEEL
jgi:hypothetical protein